MSQFLSPLELEFLNGTLWRVTAPFDYCVGSATSAVVVDVPVGFITDFASIPRLLWNVLPPTGLYGKAAVIHDKLYQTGYWMDGFTKQLVTRQMADETFLEAMEVLGVGWWTRYLIFWGVTFGGGKTWDGYRGKL